MTATNHALTGTAIGLVIGQPWIALPAAVVSHFICDALPHYASGTPESIIKTKAFRNYLIVEAGLCFLIVVTLAVTQPTHWLLAAFCAFLATSPDFLWVNRYIKTRQGKKWSPSKFADIAGRIQWFQRPIGIPVEIAWFIACLLIIAPIITG